MIRRRVMHSSHVSGRQRCAFFWRTRGKVSRRPRLAHHEHPHHPNVNLFEHIASRPEAVLSLPPLLPSLEEFLPKLLQQGIQWRGDEYHMGNLGARIEEINDEEADRIISSTDQYSVHEMDEAHHGGHDVGNNHGQTDDSGMDLDLDSGFGSWNPEDEVGQPNHHLHAHNPDVVLTDEMHTLHI